MKTIILSGPRCSGKTTRAYLLRKEISLCQDEHFEIDPFTKPIIMQIIMSVKTGKFKTVLLEASTPETIENVGVNLYKNGFEGTFIATTQERNVNVTRLVRTHEVRVYYLYRREDGCLRDKIMEAIHPVAREHQASMHNHTRSGHAYDYSYDFPDGTQIQIKEGGL